MWWIRNDDIREVLQPILRSWYQIEDEEFEHLMNELEQKGLLGGDRGPNPYLQLSFDTEKLNEIVQHEFEVVIIPFVEFMASPLEFLAELMKGGAK